MFEIILFGSIALLGYWFIIDKKNRLDIYLSLIISFLWVYFSGLYGYRGTDYTIFGLNLFAFFAWATGLIIVKKMYLSLFKNKPWIFFVIFYIIAIITLEWIGYNVWDIKLVTDYPGIFGIEAMHMPWWGKFYYLTIGLFFTKIALYKERIINKFY